jgi:hypothetical protein
MTVERREKTSSLLTIRIGTKLSRSLAREARRQRKTKSEVAREILAVGLAAGAGADPASEARRQSLLVSRRKSERETLDFIDSVADTRGWE